MKASVLINNYNYGRFLGECIESVLSQDFPNTEVIVVDDGSTDESASILAGYGDRIIPILKNNGGQASCFNAGFAAASGDIIFLLDADDMFLPAKLSTIVSIYRRYQVDWCFDPVVTKLTPLKTAAGPKVRLVDERAGARRGVFPALPTPTSGLSFTRTLLSGILPMPIADGVTLSDHYLKFASAFLGRGAMVATPLTYQRLHGANRYTANENAGPVKSQIMIKTGQQLARSYPELRYLAMHLVAGGVAEGAAGVADAWRNTVSGSGARAFTPTDRGLMLALVIGKRLKWLVGRVLSPVPGRAVRWAPGNERK